MSVNEEQMTLSDDNLLLQPATTTKQFMASDACAGLTQLEETCKTSNIHET